MIFSYNKNQNTSDLLIINKDAFAELVDVDRTKNTMRFKFRWKISLRTSEDIRDYEKLVIRVKSNETDENFNVPQDNDVIIGDSRNTSQVEKINTRDQSKKESNGFFQGGEPLSPSAQSKLSSGLNQLMHHKGIKSDGTTIVEKDLIFVPYGIPTIPKDLYEYNYTFIETYASDITPHVPKKLAENVLFNPHNAIDAINRYGVMPHSVSEESFDSRTDTYDAKFISNYLKNKKEISLDYLRYFLHVVSPSQFENKSILYETRETTKDLDFFEMTTDVEISMNYKNSKINVAFEVHKQLNEIVETKNFNIDCLIHYQAYKASIYQPELVVTGNKVDNICYLTIKDNLNGPEIVSYNVYVASFNQHNVRTSYTKNNILTSVLRERIGVPIIYRPSDPITIFKIVPVNIDGVESHVFNEIIWGQNKIINSIMIDAYKIPQNNDMIFVKVYNIPFDCKKIFLYKRRLSNGFTKEYEGGYILASMISTTIGESETTLSVPYEPGEIFEYYVSVDNGIVENRSNFMFYKHPLLSYFENPIDVSIVSTADVSFENVAFNIITTTSQKEDDKITSILKEFSPELYDYFVNSSNISTSAIPKKDYTGIIVHEVVRLNLTTCVRESFTLMGDGTFIDDNESRTKNALLPYDPYNKYVYKIITYRRNPLTLFKDYVENGEVNGKKWFYSPYKWENPLTKLTGVLNFELDGVPVIDTYETMTAEQYGLTQEIKSNSFVDAISIKNVNAFRLDIDTIRINWEINFSVRNAAGVFYDSFLVMKVVNGVRKFLGKTHKNYIYHELNKDDVGSIYYIIVPLMPHYDIDEPGYSNEIYVDSEWITPVLYRKNFN